MDLAARLKQLKESGNAAFSKKRYTEALNCYKEALAADPANSCGEAHVLHGNASAVHTQQLSRDEAEEHARKAIAAKPDWPKGHFRLGTALMAKHQYNAAVSAFEELVRLQPSDADAAACLSSAVDKREAAARRRAQEQQAARRRERSGASAAGQQQSEAAGRPQPSGGSDTDIFEPPGEDFKPRWKASKALESEAQVLFKQAAGLEYYFRNPKEAVAYSNYALWFLQGWHGKKVDLRKARALFERSAAQDVGPALTNLAYMMIKKEAGYKRDYAAAEALLLRAVEDTEPEHITPGGHPYRAYLALGLLAAKGKTRLCDPVGAAAWLEKASLAPGGDNLRQVMPTIKAMTRLTGGQWEHQRKLDQRYANWSCMPADENAGIVDYGSAEASMRRYGLDVVPRLTSAEKSIPIDNTELGYFLQWMGENEHSLMVMKGGYEMEDKQRYRKCDECKAVMPEESCCMCGICGEAYCSRTCQKKGWKESGHQEICARVVEASMLTFWLKTPMWEQAFKVRQDVEMYDADA